MFEEVTIKDDSFIEDNLLKSLGTPYFVQTLLGAARVKIKNNVVTNITTWDIVYSFVWIVLSTFSSYVFQEFYFTAFFHVDLLMYLSCFFGNALQLIPYVLTILMNKFSQRDINVKVYARLQKVDRALVLDKATYYTDFQYRWNVIIINLISVGFFIGYAVNAGVLVEEPIYTVFFAFGLLSMFMDHALGVVMIYFLAIRAKIFNAIIKNRIEEYKGNVEKKPEVKNIKSFLFSLVVPKVQASTTTDLSREKWLECLQDLLKSYKTITELFSFAIFNLSLSVLIWTFVIIATIVVGRHSGLYPLAATVTVALWAGFYYLQLITSAIINDWFIMEIKKMKLLCIRLISYDYDGPYQKTASKMIKVIHYDTPIFVVYGIFVFDKHLVLKIIGVIASNVLVLVQFII